MSFTETRLLDLLPAIHRIRDAEQGGPLEALLAVIAEQIAALEENLDQLYDDQFIETCGGWVAPYIGDLIGYRSLHGVVPGVASPRAEVANTIRFRRRKGTAAMLEQLARDVTGWPARACEFFERLGWTQHMNHVRPAAHYAPQLRRGQQLIWRDTAFDALSHTVDVRRVATSAGRYNIQNVGLFLWRIRAFSLTRSPAVADALDAGGRLLRVNPLGTDTPLYTRAETEEEITHLAEPINVPMEIERRWMAAHLDAYYGRAKSVVLELAAVNPGAPPAPIPSTSISVCNLSDIVDAGGTVIGWAHVPSPGSGKVAIDPVLGRIAFGDAPDRPVLASFHYGFTDAIGGGEYERPDAGEPPQTVQPIGGGVPLQPALDAVKNGGRVDITDSGRYVGTPAIGVAAGRTVALRAANGARPLLVASGDIVLDMGGETTVVIDGLVVSGGTLRMAAFGDSKPRTLVLRHCTLVPGADPALVVMHPFARVEIERSILGPLHVAAGAAVAVRDSIIDAGGETLVAFRGPGGDLAPGGELAIENSTIVGKVHASQIPNASNTLFVAALAAEGDTWKAPVWVDRRQAGCIRFSYVPAGSRTPRRFRCQPSGEAPDIRPHFTSLRYGDPGYCQLRVVTSDRIRRGADDESEMGVLHGLFQPHRETNLRVRLDEYLRFGLEAGIFYSS